MVGFVRTMACTSCSLSKSSAEFVRLRRRTAESDGSPRVDGRGGGRCLGRAKRRPAPARGACVTGGAPSGQAWQLQRAIDEVALKARQPLAKRTNARTRDRHLTREVLVRMQGVEKANCMRRDLGQQRELHLASTRSETRARTPLGGHRCASVGVRVCVRALGRAGCPMVSWRRRPGPGAASAFRS